MLKEEITNHMNEEGFKVINLEYMKMMSDGDDSMQKVMLEMLISELPEEIQKMRTHLDASNWEDLGSVSHKMKSTLAFVGNNVMTEANKNIEQSIKSGDYSPEISNWLKTLEVMQSEVITELNAAFSKL